MRLVGHVARMGERRGVYRVFVGKPKGKRPLGRPRRIKRPSYTLSQATNFVRRMLQVTSICWTPKTRSSRSTIFEIWKRRGFEESVESKPDPNDSTVAFRSSLRGLDSLKLASGCLRTMIRTSSEQSQPHKEIRRMFVYYEILKEKESSLPWQTSGFISSSHLQDSCIASCILLDTGDADSYDPPTVQEGVPPPWIVTFLSDFIFLLWK